MSLITDEIEKLIKELLFDQDTPAIVKTWIADELKAARTKVSAVRAQIAIVKDTTKTATQRKAALKTLIDYYTGQVV